MSKFSKEYLFRECVLHHHCILLRLKKAIKWDNDVVDEIFMTDMVLKDLERDQLLLNMANAIDSYGLIEIKAFAEQESPCEAKTVLISTDDIIDIEMIKF